MANAIVVNDLDLGNLDLDNKLGNNPSNGSQHAISKALPGGMLGMRHVALFVQNIDACLHFYVDVLGMHLEWQPDPDNYYLTSGRDNLALHRSDASQMPSGPQRLDHIGFIIATPAQVDEWHAHFVQHAVTILMQPKTHRDGARSFTAPIRLVIVCR